jgi:hypothetical protein
MQNPAVFASFISIIVETPILMKLGYYKRSEVISVSCNETKTSEAKRIEVI